MQIGGIFTSQTSAACFSMNQSSAPRKTLRSLLPRAQRPINAPQDLTDFALMSCRIATRMISDEPCSWEVLD